MYGVCFIAVYTWPNKLMNYIYVNEQNRVRLYIMVVYVPCVLHAQWSMVHMEVVTKGTRSSVEGERRERQGSTVPQGYLSAQSTETSTKNGPS